MGFLSKEMQFNFPYSYDDCFAAMLSVLSALPKHKIKSQNKSLGTIRVSLPPGMTSWTWGDDVMIHIVSDSSNTVINISSSSKSVSVLGGSQQISNIQRIIDAFSEEIKKYTQLPAEKENTQVQDSQPIEERLEKLDMLYQKKLITEAEYQAKRAEILSEL